MSDDKPFDADASMAWVEKIDGRMGGIDWDEGCAYIAGSSCTRNQFEMADRLVLIARNLAKERAALRSRCARLRAALAGMVEPYRPDRMSDVFEIDRKVYELGMAKQFFGPEEFHTRRIALEVLRETAEVKP